MPGWTKKIAVTLNPGSLRKHWAGGAWVAKLGSCQGWPPGVRLSSTWQTVGIEGWRLFDQVINNPCLYSKASVWWLWWHMWHAPCVSDDSMSHNYPMSSLSTHYTIARSEEMRWEVVIVDHCQRYPFTLRCDPDFQIHDESELLISWFTSAPSLQSWSWYRRRAIRPLKSPGYQGNDTIRVLSH